MTLSSEAAIMILIEFLNNIGILCICSLCLKVIKSFVFPKLILEGLCGVIADFMDFYVVFDTYFRSGELFVSNSK